MSYRLKFLPLFALLSLLSFAMLHSDEKEAKETPDIKKISESFGHLIGKNLASLEFDFDVAQLIQGIKDSADKKEPPMNETDCVQAIAQVQEQNFEKKAKENLDKANQFMEDNSKKEGMTQVEGESLSKLHYKVEKVGEGSSVVEEHFSPMIRYVGKFLNGEQFGASTESEAICLDETIPGFKAIIGMKEGEKRTLYIHPDLGYGVGRNGYLPPNSVLIFDVEVCKVNAPPQEEPQAEAGQ